MYTSKYFDDEINYLNSKRFLIYLSETY